MTHEHTWKQYVLVPWACLLLLSHWRNLLKQPFKVSSKRKKGVPSGISIFTLCSGHLVHPPSSAPPCFPTCASTCFPYTCRHCWRRWVPPAVLSQRWLWEAAPKISNSSFRKMAWVWGDRSSYSHSKLLWAREMHICASRSPCMPMPTLGGDIKAARASLASFFPWISITVFLLPPALGSAAV